MELMTLFLVVSPFVVDGDTFYFSYVKFRLYGLNAPERGMKCYWEAKNALEQYLRLPTQGLAFAKDRFGRYLVMLWNAEGSAASYLFSRGLAIPYPYEAPPAALGYLRDALRAWRPGCLFEPGRGEVSVVAFVYNPPGPDSRELVVLKSNVTATVTLINKRWQSVTTTVTPGLNTVTLSYFLSNKGDDVIVVVGNRIEHGIAYVPKKMTVTFYSR